MLSLNLRYTKYNFFSHLDSVKFKLNLGSWILSGKLTLRVYDNASSWAPL